MDFISDDQMKKLEGGGAPDVISDEEMAHMEQQAKPADYKVPTVPTPLTEKGRIHNMLEESLATPEQITAGANNAAAMMTGGLSKAIPKLGGVVGSALEGGLLGAAQSPDDRLAGFLKGAATQGGLSAIGKLGQKVGDKAMQFAVGRKKYTPGVGNELADQGLWGTKGMMKDQVAEKVPEAWSEMQSAANDIPGKINNRKIGQEIYDEATGPLTGNKTITPSSRDLPLMAKSRAFAENVASRGEQPASQALSHRGAAGASAFSAVSDQPLQNQVARLSKLEQAKLSQALKSADPSGRMAEADAAYAALKRAQKPLNQDETISGFGDLLGTTAKYLATPVASTVGQVGTKGGRLAEFLAPTVRQSVVTGTRKDDKKR